MTTIAISFKQDFETTSQIAVQITEPLEEHEHIWVWDHFFSLVMHKLANTAEGDELLKVMSEWATGFANKMYAPINELHADKAFIIDPKLRIEVVVVDNEEAYFIETTEMEGHWPSVNVKIPDDASKNRLAYSVIALAQHFLKINTTFFRELPMHVLAMRKFYIDEKPCSDESTVSEAPAFAFNTALKFYQSLEEKMNRE
ncbi:MAG: hypothetical protein R3240_01130 [Gammaproteobacteria bacterium]|nr:hypothetical protein [Gammaproteobacteria bacterium]